MKRFILAVLLFFWLSANSQRNSEIVTNQRPTISLGEKWLYKYFDNPVYISTGNLRNMTIQVTNGILKKGKGPGEYTIRPDSTQYTTEVTLKTGDFSRSFEFQTKHFPLPKTGFINAGENPDPRQAGGVAAYIKDFEASIDFEVDSFLIERNFGEKFDTHLNQGSEWDSTVSEWIRSAPKGTNFIIRKVYIKTGGWNWVSFEKMELYIAYD